MTGPQVAELAKTTDLAVLPIGSLETHGPHLPNGSDSFIAERVCELIADEVPCIVLPTLYYNICAQMKSFPGGAISIPPQVMIQLYDAIFSECARLGFKKIFAAVCHGGSETPVEFLANMVHERATAEVPGKPAQARLLPVQQDPLAGDGRGQILEGPRARSGSRRRDRDGA